MRHCVTCRRGRPLATTALLCALGCVALAGCGPSGPTRIEVRGKITFGGGPPPGDGVIHFAPIAAAEGFPKRPGRAMFTKGAGDFVVTSVQPGDGLVPGRYRVTVVCWQKPPSEEGTPGVSWVRSDWNPPELEIKVDQQSPVELTYDAPLQGR